MKSTANHNTADTPGRAAVGHQKKVASSGASSKAQKSSKKTSTTTTNHEDENKDAGASSRYKNYAGISTRSVKCYWEQFNNHETECQEDVYMKVAEDVTYKLWELGNALKVYSRHTGGKVTTDLVNTVLKDMNVAPVLGANNSNWDTIDCDGCHYFNSDRVVDLREEYMKEYQMLQSGPTSVTSTWVVEDEISEDLLDLFDKLCDALFLGDEETFIAALEIVESHPFICGIITLLLNKCTEMLAFEYKRGTLERTMKFLIAVTGNSYLDQNHVNLELYYLSQLMINLLLGADNDKYFESLPKLTNGEAELYGTATEEGGTVTESLPVPAEFSDIVGNLMEYTEAGQQVSGEVPLIKQGDEDEQLSIKKEIDLDQAQIVATAGAAIEGDLFNGIEPAAATTSAVGELKHDYEALFIMMENGEFGMKKLDEAQFQIKAEATTEFLDEPTNSVANTHLQILTELKQEANFIERSQEAVPVGIGMATPLNGGVEEQSADEEEEEEDSDGEQAEGGGGEGGSDEICVITTRMCDTEDVALVCQCMGRLSGFWSYMYRECAYLLLRRVEQFFLSGVILLKCEYEWLVRAIQAVFALGEIPFREFSVYVDKLHVTITPEWVTVHLNCCGIFLKDQQDAELYDLFYELCGDAILPFMLYRFMILKHLAETSIRSRIIKYKILPKVKPRQLRWLEKRTPNGLTSNDIDHREFTSLDSWFEDRTKQELKRGNSPQIVFKFAGCRPVPAKQEPQQQTTTNCIGTAEALGANEVLNRSKIIVAGRKLLSPLTNVKHSSRVRRLYDLSSFHF